MKKNDQTREQLLKELEKSNKRIAELEKSEAERKQAEGTLQTSEEKFSKAFHNNPIPIYITTIPDGVFTDVNPMVEKISGFEKDEIIGKTSLELGFFEKPEDRDKLFQQLQKDGRLNNYEISFRIKSGESRLCRVFSEIIEIQEKPYLLSMILDVTERKQAEEEMQKLAAVVKHSSELVNLSTLDGRMTFLNESGGKMLGIEPHEVENVNIMEVIPDHLTGLVEKELLPALTKGGTWEGNLQYLNMRTGELTDVHAMTFTVKDPDTGEPQFLANVSLDITERKKAEEELKKNFKQQKLLTEISYLFTKLGKFEVNMNEVLRLLGEYTKVSRVYVFEDFNNGEYTKNTYEWCHKNIEPQIDNLQEVPYKNVPSWKKILIEKGMVLSSNIFELPQDLIDILEPQKIKSIFVLPVYVRNQFFGFMGFDECEKHRIWNKNEIELLKTVTNIISTLFERRHTEKTIKESESNLRQIIDLVPHFIFVKDENGKFLIVNRAIADVYGTSVDKLIGKKDIDFASNKEEVEGFVKHDRMVIQSGKQLFIPEEQITDSKGNIRYLQTTKIPFKKSMTEQPAILGVAVDITIRKKAEEEIIKLSTAVKQSPSVIAITDLKGNLEYVNPKFIELTGYSSEEVIGQNPRILKSGELPDEIYKELWDTITSCKVWHGEFHNTKKNGEYFWEAVSVSPIFDKQGKITNYIKIAEDITERKRAEEALRESEEKYRTIFESSPEAIVLFDQKGNVVDINCRIEDWLGYKPGDIAMKNFAVLPFLSKRSKTLALKKISQRMKGEEIPPFELDFTDKNGEKRIGLITASIIRDEKGEIIQNLVMISDITERKKVEEELAKHREHLEELVQERTKELEEKNKKLKHYNELFEGREFRIKELKDKVKELEKEVERKTGE